LSYSIKSSVQYFKINIDCIHLLFYRNDEKKKKKIRKSQKNIEIPSNQTKGTIKTQRQFKETQMTGQHEPL